MWDAIQNFPPNGLVNRLGVPKKVILAALVDGWVERSPLGVCPPSTNYPGSNYLYLSICFNSVYVFCLSNYGQYLQNSNDKCLYYYEKRSYNYDVTISFDVHYSMFIGQTFLLCHGLLVILTLP